MYRLPPFVFLGLNLALWAGIVWLSAPLLSAAATLGVAVVVGGLVVGLWFATLHSRTSAPTFDKDRLVSIMERSAHARRFSIRDESTGLLNRWYLERRLDEEAARCKRYGYSMAVIVLKVGVPQLSSMSIDNWQDNSTQAAQRCLTVIRNVDLSSVLAPFEFGICLVHCDREGAEVVLERLVSELSDHNCQAGIAVLPDDDVAPSALIELARVRSQEQVAKKAA